MTPEEAVEQAYLTWGTDWGTTTSFVREQENSATLWGGTASWARISVVELPTGGQETLGPVGGRKYIRRMAVRVQIFSRTNSGVGPGMRLAEQARGIFEGKRIVAATGTMYFDDARIQRGGDDGKWLVHLMTADFFIEQVK